MEGGYAVAEQLARKSCGRSAWRKRRAHSRRTSTIPGLPSTSIASRPALEGLTPKTIVDSVITAMTSNGQVAPSYWIDPKTGNNYMLTVQYPGDARSRR